MTIQRLEFLQNGGDHQKIILFKSVCGLKYGLMIILKESGAKL